MEYRGKTGKVGKLSRNQERQAWTEAIDGKKSKAAAPQQKYSNQRTADGYSSKREARVAAQLKILADRGLITEYTEQKRFVICERDKAANVAGVAYIADFVYRDKDGFHVVDAKGFKPYSYEIKKRLMWHLLKIKIEEV